VPVEVLEGVLVHPGSRSAAPEIDTPGVDQPERPRRGRERERSEATAAEPA
jgi:hypothetical protein